MSLRLLGFPPRGPVALHPGAHRLPLGRRHRPTLWRRLPCTNRTPDVGTVKLMRGGRADPSMARYPSSFSRHPSPHPIRRTPASEASGGAPTAVDVARPGRDSARGRGPRETAARRGGCEPAHLSLALSRRLMRTRCAVVRILPRVVNHGWHHGAVRRGVATQLVGDQPAR